MPSLNIKDYIIAALLVAIISLSVAIWYKNTRIDLMQSKLDIIAAEKKAAEDHVKLVEERSTQEKEDTDGLIKNHIAVIRDELGRMRDSNASLLPQITKATRDIKAIGFEREALDRALQDYRSRVQGLIGEGAECQAALEELRLWWVKVETVYK